MKNFLKELIKVPEYNKEHKIESLKNIWVHYFYMMFVVIIIPINYIIYIFIYLLNRDILSCIKITVLYSLGIVLATLFFKFSVVRKFIRNKKTTKEK